MLHACVGQKRALFTYQGVKTLDAIAHPRLSFSSNDRAARYLACARDPSHRYLHRDARDS